MKKHSVIGLMLAATFTLSACMEIQKENNPGIPSQTTTENAPEDTTGKNTEEPDSENEKQPEENVEEPNNENERELTVEEVMANFAYDSFTTPDGMEIMLTEAVSQTNNYNLCFDFGYIRYAEPIYSDTDIDPGLYDFENYEFTAEPTAPEDVEYFRVEKGQVLDNGLTVKDASYIMGPWGFARNSVELEGEITLEGILFCFFEIEYRYDWDDLIFYPNPTGVAVPDIYCYSPVPTASEVYLTRDVDLDNEFAFICDGIDFRLGNINEVGDIDWFKDRSLVKAKVTLENLKLEYVADAGSFAYATIKNVELLDN